MGARDVGFPVVKLAGALHFVRGFVVILSVVLVVEDVVYFVFDVAHSFETVALVGFFVVATGGFFGSCAPLEG